MSCLLTYGEAWYIYKQKLSETNFNLMDEVHITQHEIKMTREKAIQYYKEKISAEFKRLGYEKNVKANYVPEHFSLPLEVVKEFSDFERRFPIVEKAVIHETKIMLIREVKKNRNLLIEMVA